MNPLNWSGPEFLALYVLLLVLSLKAGVALRWGLRQPGGPPGEVLRLADEVVNVLERPLDRDVYVVGCMAGHGRTFLSGCRR